MVEDGWEEREHTEGGAQKGGKRERESRTWEMKGLELRGLKEELVMLQRLILNLAE